MITWNPWNPVAKQKVDPYTESAIVNEASQYSIPCNIVNINPNATVTINPKIASLLSPLINALCDHVIVAPELNKIAVFNNGTSNASNGTIPIGGHILPISTVGTKALWKNAQKNEKKKHTSDTINNIIPNFNPFCTTSVCNPVYVASLITSLHQTPITSNNSNVEIIKIISP